MTLTHDTTTTAATPVRQVDRLYHDTQSSTETTEIRTRAREFASKFVAPAAARIAAGDEVDDGFPFDVFGAMANQKIFEIPFPADVHGAGLARPSSATAAVVEELAYYSNSVAAIFDVHCILAGNALNQGSPEQRNRWLTPLVRGEIIGAFATSEPGASSDLSPQAVQTVATRTATGWRLDGRKRWITNSPVADVIVILARTGERLSLFIVPTTTPGVSVGRADRKLGNKGQLTADVILDGVELPDDALLGTEGGGLKIALSTLTYGRIGIAAAGVGMAQAAFDHMADRLSTREAFGRKLGSMQHWQFLMADHALALESARTLYIKAAIRLDEGNPFPEPEAAMAKLAGTELSVTIARDAVQVFGGLGFTRELGADGTPGPVEAIYRDSKIGEIYEGANEVQKWIIARQLLGRDITG
ncbi:acyl-CoA dehydrogenase [Rhodococcus sp. ACS1]|uniref:acyl-CoA dehydrogenase family protein n=1 Tax=Rhodococcus sp. ACS1 TaxID=2028570 RepID=UPI000BB130B1|nr:acyl-CoA dehydrogenase family protein [Rhodococcus sp. ACS1]PBC36799.1 acyl-CoA dehydrogenase [Rhodococcus sp. ACS1]